MTSPAGQQATYRCAPSNSRERGIKTRVVGVEPSAGMRRQAVSVNSHPDVFYVGGTAQRLPVRPGTVGLAVAMNLLHHVDDRAAASIELVRVVRSEGALVVFLFRSR